MATTPTYEDFLIAMVLRSQSQTPELTDVQPGSVYRSLLSAVADEMEVISIGAAEAVADAVNESAYRLWSFDRAPAAAANGVVTLTANGTVTTDITIPAGTTVRVPGTDNAYRTLSAYTFPAGVAGSTLSLYVVSIGAGARYNTAATTITEFVSAPSLLLSVSNPVAFTNGADEESDAVRQQRFASFVRSLHRATAESLAFAAEQAVVVDANGLVIERVTDAVCVDVAGSVGLARLYISNGSATTASSSLLNAANAQAQLYKAAGVTVQTLAATLSSVAVTLTVVLDLTVSLPMVKTTIQQAITNLVAALGIGDTLYRSEIIRVVASVPGVVDVNVTSPASNVVPALNTQIVLVAVPGVS